MDETEELLPEDDSVFEAIVNDTTGLDSDAIVEDSFSSIQDGSAFLASSTPVCSRATTRSARRPQNSRPSTPTLPTVPESSSPSMCTRSRTRISTPTRSESPCTRRSILAATPTREEPVACPSSPAFSTRSRARALTSTRSQACSQSTRACEPVARPTSPVSSKRARARPAAVSAGGTAAGTVSSAVSLAVSSAGPSLSSVHPSSSKSKKTPNSARIKCSVCPETLANERTYQVHKKMHAMKRVFSQMAQPDCFMEKLPDLTMATFDSFLNEKHVGKYADATRNFIADLKQSFLTSEEEHLELCKFLHQPLYDILVDHCSVFSMSLVHTFYVGVNILMNKAEFKEDLKTRIIPCLNDTHQMEVINLGIGNFMHLLSSHVVLYFMRIIHGGTAQDEIRRKRSNDSIDSKTFLEMAYYIGGSVVNGLMFKAKKYKESNPNWSIFFEILSSRFLKVEGVGNSCSNEVTHFTEAVDRGKLKHISQEALDFFVVLFDFLMSLEDKDGQLPANVVEDYVLENMTIICLWDVLVGSQLEDDASLDYLIQTSNTCKLIVLKGILKRRLNDNLKKAVAAVSLRSRLAE